MFTFKKNVLFIIFFAYLLSTFPIYSLEKEGFVAFLKEYDASQNKCNGKVAYAIENNYPDVAKFLLLRGEDPSQYTTTYPLTDYQLNWYIKHPLITAIKKGYTGVAVLMIQMGHSNAEEYRIEHGKFEVARKNAMYVAIEHNNHDIAWSLLLAGFDINTSSALNPPTLHANGRPVYQDRSVYTTPLLQAIESQNLNIAELLLKHGADVEKISQSTCLFDVIWSPKNTFSGSPLLKAVDDNFIEGVLLLVSYGANPLRHDIFSSSFSPLERAVQKGYFDIVDVLFDATVNSSK